MGGCASKPKDLDLAKKAAAEANAADKVKSDTASQQNSGGENGKAEEATTNPSNEPKEEAQDSEETKPAEDEEKEDGQGKDKADEDSLAEFAVIPEPVMELEPVKEEEEQNEANTSDDKSDEPLVTI